MAHHGVRDNAPGIKINKSVIRLRISVVDTTLLLVVTVQLTQKQEMTMVDGGVTESVSGI